MTLGQCLLWGPGTGHSREALATGLPAALLAKVPSQTSSLWLSPVSSWNAWCMGTAKSWEQDALVGFSLGLPKQKAHKDKPKGHRGW